MITLNITIEEAYAIINALASLQNNIQRQVAEQINQPQKSDNMDG